MAEVGGGQVAMVVWCYQDTKSLLQDWVLPDVAMFANLGILVARE